MTWTTRSGEETVALGHKIAGMLPPKALVLLIGNLGAGKTTLAKGILEGLGVAQQDEVSSPTFTLIHEFGEGRAYHIDLYRLETENEVRTLGLDDILDRDSVVLIEWGERFPHLFSKNRFEIRLNHKDEDSREITLTNLV